jgi:hypothetical protein
VLERLNMKFEGKKTYTAIIILIVTGILKQQGLIDDQIYSVLFTVGSGLALYGRWHASRHYDKSEEKK